MNPTFQNTPNQREPVSAGLASPLNPATGPIIPSKTAAAPFWEQCSLLWTSLAANPLLPDRESHSEVLNSLQNLYRAVHHVISPELSPATPLDHSVVESVRVFVIEHLAHIARALDIIARKLNMRGAAAVRGFLAADELQVFVTWVDGLVAQERDQEKVWDVCGYCLLQAVTQLYGIFPMLRRIQVMYETAVTAG